MQVGAKTARLRRRILIAEQRAATAEGAMETRMPDDTAAAVRRTDLDWLRIGAFGVLIVFHVGMFYVPWEWEVKSPRLVPWRRAVPRSGSGAGGVPSSRRPASQSRVFIVIPWAALSSVEGRSQRALGA